MKAGTAVVLVLAFFLFTSNACVAARYSVIDLGTIGGTTVLLSEGVSVNSYGQVTGRSLFAGSELTGDAVYHAFLFDGSIHDLGTLAGFDNSRGYGINDQGKVVGYSFKTGHDNAASDIPFLYDGSMHSLGTLGGTGGAANAINSSGAVTGGSYLAGNLKYHAFLYDGVMHDIGTIGNGAANGTAINNRGQVTGNAGSLGFFYDGTMHDIGSLGGGGTTPYAINDSAQIAGMSFLVGGSSHAFLYDGAMHDLGTLGGTGSGASGINNSGTIVGKSYLPGNTTFHAFIYDGVGGMVDMNSLISPSSGWTLMSAYSINDSGQISGFGKIGTTYHGFLLSPVPEPDSLVLIVLGVVAIVLSVRFVRRARSRS